MSGSEKVSVVDVDSPIITAPGDVLVRMRSCGLCGSDLEKVYGHYSMASGRLGHEPAGEIISVGPAVKEFAQGDRVFMHHHVACYSCHYCNHGDFTMCPKYQESNISPCGLAQLVLVPEWNVSRGGLLKLPQSVSYDEAAMIEPLACCIRAWNKCSFQRGDKILVIGAGPAGLMHVMLAREFGADSIHISDVNRFRLDYSRKFGAIPVESTDQQFSTIIRDATESRGVDISIVATGNVNGIMQAFDVTRKGGQIMLFGVPPKGSQVPVDFGKLYSAEISLIPSYAASEKETAQALDLIARHRVDVSSLITHRFNIQSADEAVRCAHEARDAVKVIVTNE